MPSTTTTNVTVSNLLDVLGTQTTAPAGSKVQPAFDVLLQPPTVTRPPAPIAPDNSPPAARVDDTAERRPAPQPPGPTEPVTSQEPSDSSAPQKDPPSRPQPDPSATSQKSTSDGSNEDRSQQAGESVVAQSLAGLAAIAPPKTPANLSPDPEQTNGVAATDNSDGKMGVDKRPADAPAVAVQPAASKTTKPESSGKQRIETSETAVEATHDTNEAAINRPHDKQTVGDTIKVEQPVKSSDAGKPSEQPTAADSTAATAQSTPEVNAAPHSAREVSSSADASASRPDAALATPQPNDATTVTVNSLPPPPVVAVTAPTATVETPVTSSKIGGAITTTNAPPPQRSRLPAELLSQSTTGPARRTTVEIDANRLLTRIARAFTAAQDRDGEVRLRLSPPELGALRLEVRVQDGVLVAHLQTETDAARTAILDNLPTLRDRLADQGVRIERFDVDLMQRQPGGGGGMPDQPGSRQQDSPGAGLQMAPAPRPRTEASVNQSTPVASVDSTSGLNVII